MITLEKIQKTEGVKSVNSWKNRNYINFEKPAVTKVWEENGKLYVQRRKGRDSTEALETIERLIGCNLVDIYSKAADYVVVK